MMLINSLPRLIAQTDSAEAGGVASKAEIVKSISNNFTSDGLISTHWLFLAAGVVFVFLSTVSLAHWWKHRHEHSHPWLIFMATARKVGLGLRDQWALYWISHQQKLGSPITLMLSPGTFDHHVKAYLDARLGWRQESLRRRSQSIREHLYGDLGTQTFTS